MKGCTHCAAAKGLLEKAGIAFTALDIHFFERRYATAVADSGMQTVPIVYVGRFLVGGRSDLEGILGNAEVKVDIERALAEFHRRRTESDASTGATADDLPDFLAPLTDEETAQWTEHKEASEGAPQSSRLYEPEFTIPGKSGNGRKLKFNELLNAVRGKGGVEVKDRGFLWRKKRTFIAKELVGVVRRDICGTLASEEDAVELCRSLHQRHMIEPYDQSTTRFVGNDDLWRFVVDHGSHSMNRDRIFEVAPDNDDGSSPLPKRRNGSDVAHDLRVWLGVIIEKFVTPDGVAYHKMQDDEDFQKFTEAVTELQTVDLDELSRAEKIAFGINTYNMAVLHAYAIRGPPSGFFDMYRFFNSIGYDIGGHHYTLNDIENGFLRGNRKAIGAFSLPFDHKDPRLEFAVENPDYRIHFALNCGAKSCPPIKVFTADKLDEELQRAADAFMSSNATFEPDRRVLRVSKIISWYAEDFTTPTMGPVELCVKHLPKDIAADCRDVGLENIKLEYMAYDWSTNAVPKNKR
eukprot:CAMPEP_0174841876 /NCGR_PEP_ID=MMETSP1114-20130205/9590_1 /TAXON_ID=312471 /ORGANISM="Neobodo designis, Strain CCAP 1951/1" /LENGTH=520 /DNA_ID=CAMNT_0016076075 /DNA_START=100 /DNA_END=1662 /DNA_ORIENTATION=+